MLSKALGTVVPIPHTPCSKATSQGIKAQDLLSAPSHLLGQDRQPWHNPSTTTHWQSWQRWSGPWAPQRVGTPLPGTHLLPARSRTGDAADDTWRLLVTQPLSGEKPFCLNELQCRPLQNTEAFIPQEVLLSGETAIALCHPWAGSLKHIQGSVHT